MTKLVLASDLSLPADVANYVTLIAGKRGSGKTNTAKRLVEQLNRAHVPFGVLDVVDVWWGLKAGVTGTREGGLPIYVFGGKHADYPLEPTGGRLMAGLFVDYRISAVMAMREWTGADRARFVTDFADELLRRNSETFEVVVEEAHDLIPLIAMGEEKRSKGAMLRMEKLGRSSGIGMALLTQRLAALDNTARSQADLLVMHRTTGPHDRKALNGWIEEHHADVEERNAFLGALPTLKTGEAFVWGPDFPEDKPIGLVRVRILECETFNSHATPKVGEKRSEPKELTPVDLERLSKAMSATVEKAKQDDPAELRRTIGTLRRELAGAQKAVAPTRLEIKEIERSVLKEGQLDRAHELEHSLESTIGRAELVIANLREAIAPISSALRAVAASTSAPTAVRAGSPAAARPSGISRAESGQSAIPPRRTSDKPRYGEPRVTTDGISGPQQRMLDALAWLEAVGVRGARWSVLGFLSRQSPKSSGFEKNVSTLRSGELIQGNGKNQDFTLTRTGRAAANAPDAPATSEELHRAIFAKISTPQERMLRALIESYPRNLTWDELAERGEQSPNSSGFEKNVSTLKSYGLIGGSRGTGYVALEHLFLEERVR
jgi:hypothetical protein